jgi:hypothetical protein
MELLHGLDLLLAAAVGPAVAAAVGPAVAAAVGPAVAAAVRPLEAKIDNMELKRRNKEVISGPRGNVLLYPLKKL